MTKQQPVSPVKQKPFIISISSMRRLIQFGETDFENVNSRLTCMTYEVFRKHKEALAKNGKPLNSVMSKYNEDDVLFITVNGVTFCANKCAFNINEYNPVLIFNSTLEAESYYSFKSDHHEFTDFVQREIVKPTREHLCDLKKELLTCSPADRKAVYDKYNAAVVSYCQQITVGFVENLLNKFIKNPPSKNNC